MTCVLVIHETRVVAAGRTLHALDEVRRPIGERSLPLVTRLLNEHFQRFTNLVPDEHHVLEPFRLRGVPPGTSEQSEVEPLLVTDGRSVWHHATETGEYQYARCRWEIVPV